MIVSVHVPKTAGMSVLAFLEAALGKAAVRRDYRGGPAIEGGASPPAVLFQRALDRIDRVRLARAGDEVGAVHGHFRASKYADLDAPLIGWVRDPVERVASHYQHFRRLPEKNRHAEAVRAGLGLVDFAARPGLRDLQCRYLDVPLERFAFVGRTGRFAEDLPRMAERLGLPALAPELRNTNPHRSGDRWEISAEDREAIRALNPGDVALVERIDEVFGP